MSELENFLSQHKPVFRNNLDEIALLGKYDLHSNSVRDIADRIKPRTGRKLVLYGAGESGMLAFESLMEHGIKADMYCDSYSCGTSMIVGGGVELPIVKPDSFVGMDGGADIVITSISGYVHILKHLESLGLAENVAGIFPLSASLMQEQKAILESNIEKIIEVYEILSDTKSQEVFTNFLNFRMTRDFSYILGIADGMEHQYFDKEIIKTSSEEVFADCGACNGDTLAEFIRYSRNEFKRIVCFEPNGEMYGELRNRIEELRDNRVAAVQAAVYKESGKLGFAIRGDSTSRIDDSEAVNVVECVGLDDYFGGESCTFIKMDIEGSEADALAGARGTIAKNKPKLAFSVYHKPEDLWALPLLVRSILPEYRVYMRHYGRSYHETVCYACV